MQAGERVKKDISNILHLPYEEIAKMEIEEEIKLIESKIGKKLGWRVPPIVDALGSGDDSVAIDRGRIRTMEEVEAKLDEIIAEPKDSLGRQL